MHEPGIEQFGYKQELSRVLTTKDLLFYGMVFMVPIAPMGIYGHVVNVSNGMAPLAYLIGIIAMVFTAYSYANMANAFPIAGSVYSYASRGINPYIGFLAGWSMLLDYFLSPALVYLVAGYALQEMFPIIPFWGYIILFIVLNTFINMRGIEFTAGTNKFLAFFELLVLAVFVIAAIIAVSHGVGEGQFNTNPIFKPEGFNIDMVMAATSLAVLSFLGFDAISTLAEETKDPRSMVGRATILALVVIGSLFIAQTWLAGLILPETSFSNPDTAFYDVAVAAGGVWLKYLVAFATAVAWGLGDGLVAQAAVARLLYSMSRDRLLPSVLSKVHPKYHTPYVSTLVVAVLAITVGVIVSMDQLTSMVNFGALTGFLFLHVSVFYHYVVKQKRTDFSSLLKYLIMPLIGFSIIFYVWISLQPEAKTIGFIWLAVGIIYCAIVTRGFKQRPPALEE